MSICEIAAGLCRRFLGAFRLEELLEGGLELFVGLGDEVAALVVRDLLAEEAGRDVGVVSLQWVGSLGLVPVEEGGQGHCVVAHGLTRRTRRTSRTRRTWGT